MNSLVLAATLIGASAHMAVLDPIPLDAAIGDAYRHPVSSDNNPTDGGACHGQTAGASYAWVWTPAASGTCEMYQSCFDTLPPSGELKMSFGAAHNGGPCKLYSCPNGVNSVPLCDRVATGISELPTSYDGCTAIASEDDCTLKGSMSFTGAGGGTAVSNPPTLPPNQDNDTIGNPDATASKIRCGSSWLDANSKCGTPCATNAECTSASESCFADLADCPSGSGTPDATPTRPIPSLTPVGCVSSVGHITDQHCKDFGCDDVYVNAGYCKTNGDSATSPLLQTTTCILYASFAGETWGDVAIKYDVSLQSLKEHNVGVLGGALEADTVVEIPGDCNSARNQVAGIAGASVLRPAAALAACAFLAVARFV